MRNLISLAVCAVALAAVLGCGVTDRAKKEMGGEANVANTNANANKTITDKAIESVAGEGKVGIAECDEVIDILAVQANTPDENFVTKAMKATALTQFKEQVKKRLDANKTNRADIAKFCRDFRSSLQKSSTDAEANKE
jgi:hypothetical protein